MERTKVTEHGPSEGTAHVLLHGVPGDASDFARVVERRGDRRVLVIEMPDHGQAPASTAGLEETERAVLRAIQEVGAERLRLCGYSMGGYLAGRLLPRLGDRVERLVTVSGLAHMDAEGAAARRQLGSMIEAGGEAFAQVREAVANGILGEDGARDPEVVQIVRTMLAAGTADQWLRYVRRALELAEPGRAVQPFSTPAVILQGARDVLVPLSLGEAYASLGSDARLDVIDTDAHCLPLTHPERVADALFG